MILYFGRVDAIAKADLRPLIDAYAAVSQASPRDVVLVIAGAAEPGEFARLQQAAAERNCAGQILFRDRPTLAEAPLYYSAADIFVGLSGTVQESFGLAPLEAMAAGLPVVVSDWSGYHETVLDGVTGFRIPTAWGDDGGEPFHGALGLWRDDFAEITRQVCVSPDALRAALQSLVANRDKREHMGDAARRHAQENYAWPVILAQYGALWHKLITAVPNANNPHTAPKREQMRYRDNFAHFAHV